MYNWKGRRRDERIGERGLLANVIREMSEGCRLCNRGCGRIGGSRLLTVKRRNGKGCHRERVCVRVLYFSPALGISRPT